MKSDFRSAFGWPGYDFQKGDFYRNTFDAAEFASFELDALKSADYQLDWMKRNRKCPAPFPLKAGMLF